MIKQFPMTEGFSKKLSPLIIGLSGGSCSGKTTLARGLAQLLGEEYCSVLFQDSYYRDVSKEFSEGREINFDHPSSLDFDLLGDHLKSLKCGNTIDVPCYDFLTHSRSLDSMELQPRAVILVDGILILTQPQVRGNLDLAFFVEADEEIRFERRKKRDVAERGRTLEYIESQFAKYVAPMHDTFVEPSKSYANHILDGNGALQGSLNILCKAILQVADEMAFPDKMKNNIRVH